MIPVDDCITFIEATGSENIDCAIFILGLQFEVQVIAKLFLNLLHLKNVLF